MSELSQEELCNVLQARYHRCIKRAMLKDPFQAQDACAPFFVDLKQACAGVLPTLAGTVALPTSSAGSSTK